MLMAGSSKSHEEKLEINKDAMFHRLLKSDSITLMRLYNEIKTEIDVIIMRDDLPKDVWFPSEDFEYLIRQIKE